MVDGEESGDGGGGETDGCIAIAESDEERGSERHGELGDAERGVEGSGNQSDVWRVLVCSSDGGKRNVHVAAPRKAE